MPCSTPTHPHTHTQNVLTLKHRPVPDTKASTEKFTL